MRSSSRYLRAAVLVAVALAVGGSLAAQNATRDRIRRHRIFAAQSGPDQVTLAWDAVPGATEYRVYLPDANRPGPPTAASRPYTVTSGSGRRTMVNGVQRLANGAYLEAVGNGQVLYRGTFNAVTRASLTPVAVPGRVQARETGTTEVTVSWSPVPGATAYMIARAAGGSGWKMACDFCPPNAEFVDTTATPGLKHTYSVQAIFPLGISARTPSNTVLVGETQLAAATATTPSTATTWDKPMDSGTPVAGTDADNTNSGASGSTTTGTSTPTTGTGTPTTGTGTPTTGTGTPTTGTGTPTTGTGTPTLQPPTQTNATVAGVKPGSAWVTWGPSPSTGVAGYTVYRNINGGTFSPLRQFGNNAFGFADSAFAATLFAAGPVKAAYYVVATGSDGATSPPSTTTYQVQIQAPVAATPPAASCKLDYQRADNMWADFGRPDGFLGTESISLANGLTKVFITDWTYEKQRNDGTNYYGSHLRVATNAGSGVVRLRVRNPATALLGGIAASTTLGWITVQPGVRGQFRDDLMEVRCGL